MLRVFLPALAAILLAFGASPAIGVAQSGTGVMTTIQAGAGSARGWNYASIALEMFPGDQDSLGLFAVAGLGTIMVGGGVAWYGDRDGTGPVASAVAGVAGAHVNGGWQIRLGELGFLAAGAGYGAYFLQHQGFLPYLSWEYRL